MVIKKQYIEAQELLEDSFRLGIKVVQSEFRPNYLIGVWRGGAPVAIAVHETLDYFGIQTDHIAIRTALYAGIDQRRTRVQVSGVEYLAKQIDPTDQLLIVDDVFDTGLSIKAIKDELLGIASSIAIRVATPWYKPVNNQTDDVPDFYLHETENWLVFPHELIGLSMDEIAKNKLGLDTIFSELPPND